MKQRGEYKRWLAKRRDGPARDSDLLSHAICTPPRLMGFASSTPSLERARHLARPVALSPRRTSTCCVYIGARDYSLIAIPTVGAQTRLVCRPSSRRYRSRRVRPALIPTRALSGLAFRLAPSQVRRDAWCERPFPNILHSSHQPE